MANQFRISKKEKTVINYFIDLHREFPDSSEFADIFHTLDIANADDVIVFKIGSNDGGILETNIKLINNIKLCKATISIVVDSVCYSAASIFVIAMLTLGFDVRFMPNVFLMFHDYSSEEEGKGSEIVVALHNNQEWVKDIYLNYCYPFLNKAEINKIMQGKDMYINFDDINKRLAKIKND